MEYLLFVFVRETVPQAMIFKFVSLPKKFLFYAIVDENKHQELTYC